MKKIIITAIFIKLTVFLIIFLAYNLLPTNLSGHYLNFLYPNNQRVTLLSAYKTWDAQHFLFLSEKGYSKDQISNQFLPLLPLTISAVSVITRNSFFTGMLVSNIASLIAFYFLYKLVNLLHGKKIAFDSLIFLFAFPVSFYLSLIYTESIFLALVCSSFYFLYKRNYLLVALISFFIPLERIVGVFIIIPFVTFYVFEEKQFTLKSQVADIVKSFLSKKFILLFTPLLGFLSYFIYIFSKTGNPFALFDALRYSVIKTSVFYMLKPLSFLQFLFSNITLHGFNTSIIDRLFLLFFLIMLYPIYKKTNKTFFVYSLIMGLFFILVGMTMSYTRHLLIVFPVFVTLAILLKDEKYNYLKFSLIYFMLMLQGLFLVMHALNYWVA